MTQQDILRHLKCLEINNGYVLLFFDMQFPTSIRRTVKNAKELLISYFDIFLFFPEKTQK